MTDTNTNKEDSKQETEQAESKTDLFDLNAACKEICLFDLETTFGSKGQSPEIIEFGCINVCRIGLYERSSYGTLIKPTRDKVSKRSAECNGITTEMLDAAPTFSDVAAIIYENMHQKIWCGHNIRAFDIPHLTKAFQLLNLPPPECVGVVDSLDLMRKLFNSRAGSNKMADLCDHFGLGQEKHRAISDCRHTLEAMKSVALSLLLEGHYSSLFPVSKTPVKPKRKSTSNSTPTSSRQSMTSISRTSSLTIEQSPSPSATTTSSSMETVHMHVRSESNHIGDAVQDDLMNRLAAVALDDTTESPSDIDPVLRSTVITLIDNYSTDPQHPPVRMKYLSQNPLTTGQIRQFRSLQWVSRPERFTAVLEIPPSSAVSSPISASKRDPNTRLNFLVKRVASLESAD